MRSLSIRPPRASVRPASGRRSQDAGQEIRFRAGACLRAMERAEPGTIRTGAPGRGRSTSTTRCLRLGAEAVKRADPTAQASNAGFSGIGVPLVDGLRTYKIRRRQISAGLHGRAERPLLHRAVSSGTLPHQRQHRHFWEVPTLGRSRRTWFCCGIGATITSPAYRSG